MRANVSVNRPHPASAIQDGDWTSRLDGRDGSRRAAIYGHPMVSAMFAILGNVSSSYYGQRRTLKTAADVGYTVGASDLGYFTTQGWGNPAEQVRVGELAAWARTAQAAGGLGGSPSKPLVAVGFSAGAMGLINYFGQAGDPDDVAAFVLGLVPYDLRALWDANVAGVRSGAGAAWGVTYPTPLPAHASPKDNIGPLAGKHVLLPYASDDPLNGSAVVADMVAAIGANAVAIDVGALGHTEAAIDAIAQHPDVWAWLLDVAAP